MVKVQAIIDFTYKNYDKIQNLESVDEKEEGKIFDGDIFEIENEEALYLTGKNDKDIVAVKVLEILPDKLVEIEADKVETEFGTTNVKQTKEEIVMKIMRINEVEKRINNANKKSKRTDINMAQKEKCTNKEVKQ